MNILVKQTKDEQITNFSSKEHMYLLAKEYIARRESKFVSFLRIYPNAHYDNNTLYPIFVDINQLSSDLKNIKQNQKPNSEINAFYLKISQKNAENFFRQGFPIFMVDSTNINGSMRSLIDFPGKLSRDRDFTIAFPLFNEPSIDTIYSSYENDSYIGREMKRLNILLGIQIQDWFTTIEHAGYKVIKGDRHRNLSMKYMESLFYFQKYLLRLSPTIDNLIPLFTLILDKLTVFEEMNLNLAKEYPEAASCYNKMTYFNRIAIEHIYAVLESIQKAGFSVAFSRKQSELIVKTEEFENVFFEKLQDFQHSLGMAIDSLPSNLGPMHYDFRPLVGPMTSATMELETLERRNLDKKEKNQRKKQLKKQKKKESRKIKETIIITPIVDNKSTSTISENIKSHVDTLHNNFSNILNTNVIKKNIRLKKVTKTRAENRQEILNKIAKDKKEEEKDKKQKKFLNDTKRKKCNPNEIILDEKSRVKFHKFLLKKYNFKNLPSAYIALLNPKQQSKYFLKLEDVIIPCKELLVDTKIDNFMLDTFIRNDFATYLKEFLDLEFKNKLSNNKKMTSDEEVMKFINKVLREWSNSYHNFHGNDGSQSLLHIPNYIIARLGFLVVHVWPEEILTQMSIDSQRNISISLKHAKLSQQSLNSKDSNNLAN